MISLVHVSTEGQIANVAILAERIWNEYFPAIISQGQVDYMVDRFQSRQAISDQINTGYQYYLISNGRKDIGYIGLAPQDTLKTMQISKFYILKESRGKGVGRQALAKVIVIAKKTGYQHICLTVNKYNLDAISAYEKLGFNNMGERITEIGNGYVMDDYVMEMSIQG